MNNESEHDSAHPALINATAAGNEVHPQSDQTAVYAGTTIDNKAQTHQH
jgi:hypothetical protein